MLASAKVAVLAESDLTGRRRAHRQARPRARPVEGFFDDLQPGDYVVHHVHGVARYAGMVKRAIGGGDRDYLLLEYRGDDKLYVPSDQIDAITPYSGGDSPSLSRLGGTDWQKQKARVRAAVARGGAGAGGPLPAADHRARPRLLARHPLAARARAGLSLHRDDRPAASRRGREGGYGEAGPDGSAGLRGRRLRQDRGGGPRRVQGGAGRAAGGSARSHDPPRPAALPDVLRPLRPLPGEGRDAVAAS